MNRSSRKQENHDEVTLKLDIDQLFKMNFRKLHLKKKKQLNSSQTTT